MNQPPIWPDTRHQETAHIVDSHTTEYIAIFRQIFAQIDSGMQRPQNYRVYQSHLDGGVAPVNDPRVYPYFDEPLKNAIDDLYYRLSYYTYAGDPYVLRIRREAKTAITKADGSYLSDAYKFTSIKTPDEWEVRHPPQ